MLKTAEPFYVTVGCHSALPTAGGQASQGVWGHAASPPPQENLTKIVQFGAF